jgi:putative copper resistance protein D
MPLENFRKPPKLLFAVLALAAFAVLPGPLSMPALAAQESGHEHTEHQQHAEHATAAPVRVKSAAEIEADKRFSELNHRIAGIFVLLVGLLTVFEPRLAARYPWTRYLWSVFFFAPGVYLLIWSDPESWPTGKQTLHYVITQNMQVLQHKIFSLILLGLGIVEFIRVRRSAPSVWLSSVFPALAGLGALLLLYHSPLSHAGMGPEAHQAMETIEHQHIGFAVAGFGIALSKALADIGSFRPRLMQNLFAVLMTVLAILLLTYSE